MGLKSRFLATLSGTPVGVRRAGAGQEPPPGGLWTEVSPVPQDAPPSVKRWYCHPRADLFTWTSPDGQILSLQFCFDRDEHEGMVAWDRGRGSESGSVDLGDSSPVANRSPVLRPGGASRAERARTVWVEIRDGLPEALVALLNRVLGL